MRFRKKNYNPIFEFEKAYHIDEQIIDKVTLWALRIILKLGGHNVFLDNSGYFSKDELAYFLDIGQFTKMDSDEYSIKEPYAILQNRLYELEQQKELGSITLLSKNIANITKLMNLSRYEEAVLEFVVIVKQYDIMENFLNLLGSELNTTQVKRALSVILDIPKHEIDAIFNINSKFSKSSLITFKKDYRRTIDGKFESNSDNFLDNLLNLDEDIAAMIKDIIKPCNKSELSLKNYKHIADDLAILVPYLKNAIATKQSGVNILLYGLPGTGKTELVKVLAQKLKTQIFEVSYTNENDESIDGPKRLRAYKCAQSLLNNKKTLLMYDEAEDIFESSRGGFFAPPQRQRDKAWINRVLESNSIPTIWITNNIDSIDNAIVRRFDMSIELPIPPKTTRKEIIKNYSNNLLDDKTIENLALNENIAPALISRAAKVASNIGGLEQKDVMTHIVNNTLKAQGFKGIEKEVKKNLSANYDPSYINTSMNLQELTLGIKETMSARLCLYGVPGTGKSAYGKYIADTLHKPLMLVKGSDLLSKYLGETEQNIAKAFAHAKEDDAVLVFDEVDSFLADRSSAQRSWEISQVNEMLVQMENFDGVFIATTNLMDNLDKASLRRFDLKLEFGFLTPTQSWKMFLSYVKLFKFPKPSASVEASLKNLRQLTPGDFAAVARQNRFRPLRDANDLLERLQNEVTVKQLDDNKRMGFLS